jgi:sec-independent protein translocase protein TatC
MATESVRSDKKVGDKKLGEGKPAPTQGRGGRMPLTGHLRELRDRLVSSAVVTGLAFCLTYYYSQDLYDILKAPLLPALPDGSQFMAFHGVVEPFFVYLKIGIVAAIILASPFLIYHTWAFLLPALKDTERVWFLPVVFCSFLLFTTGVWFAYEFVFPVGFKYLMSFATDDFKPFLSMSLYFSLATKLLLAFGVVFQLPLVILVLARLGIVDGWMLIRWWRFALLTAVILGALLTPPDVFSQVLMGGPIMVLYGLGIIVAFIFGKKKEKEED